MANFIPISKELKNCTELEDLKRNVLGSIAELTEIIQRAPNGDTIHAAPGHLCSAISVARGLSAIINTLRQRLTLQTSIDPDVCTFCFKEEPPNSNRDVVDWVESSPAFSKRFVGAGHSEEGGGQGSEGILARALRGSGGISRQNVCEIWMLKGAIWCSLGGSKASKLYFICLTLFTITFNKMTKHASLLTQIQLTS